MVLTFPKAIPGALDEPCPKLPNSSLSIRYYRPSDNPNRMRDMFGQSNLGGPNAPFTIAKSRFVLPTIALYGFSYTGLACLIILSTKPGYIARFLMLDGEKAVFWIAIAISLASSVALLYLQAYRRMIDRVFQVYIEDADEDFRDIFGRFGMVNQSGGPSSFLSGSSGFWVAEEGDEIIGFVGLDANVSEKCAAEVRRLVVSPSHHRRGVGTKLMDAVMKHARANGIVALELTTSNYNIGALNLYKRRGWWVKAKVPYEGIFLNVLRKDL